MFQRVKIVHIFRNCQQKPPFFCIVNKFPPAANNLTIARKSSCMIQYARMLMRTSDQNEEYLI